VAILLGVFVAASFGTGDFLGGSASRRVPTVVVLATAQCCALVGAGVMVAVFAGDATARDLILGFGAGALNVVALGCLYAGLAAGRMGIVAPLTAVIAACIPVVWGIANGESLPTLAFVGVVLAIGAGGLVAHERDEATEEPATRAILLAIAAGTLFGSSLVAYSETSHASGAWPLLAGRVVAVVLAVGAALVVARRLSIARPERSMAIGAGLLDVAGTGLLLVAVRDGLIALVVPVAALGPAFTVIWAWLVLHEPIGRLQLVGLVAALAGLTMITAAA
jgi:drug/metabolite transporter (DMT)-like permease